MPKKKVEEDEEEEEFDDDEEEFEEETFTCRLCNKETEAGEGDDLLALCDDCIDKFDINVDKIWDQYDKGKISDDELTTIDLKPYSKKLK